MKNTVLFVLCFPFFLFAQELEAPIISHETGFYTDAFELTMEHEDADATILFTWDGSVPKIENVNGQVWHYKKQYPALPTDELGELLNDTIRTFTYSSPVHISLEKVNHYSEVAVSMFENEEYRTLKEDANVPIFKSVVMRAVAYKDGEYSEVITKNYLIDELGKSRFSLPVVALTVPPEEFYDYENGIYVPGKKFDDWRTENVGDVANRWSETNYSEKGSSTEKEINFTYIVDGKEELNHGAGIRLNGNTSRIYPNKSIRLYAKSGYGEKNFKYPFFEGDEANEFKRLILRNSGQDAEETMLKDGFYHFVSKDMNFATQGFQPTIVLVNGEYFGLYNLRERYDKKYFDKKFGVDEEELDFIQAGEVKEGDDIAYFEMWDFITQNPMEEEMNFQEAETLVDMENIIDYFIAETFAGNQDWMPSNVDYWRKRVPYTPDADYGNDGRWRWILKDLDFSWGRQWGWYSYTENDIERVTLEGESEERNEATKLFRSLLENNTFKTHFVRRYCDLMNTTYNTDHLLKHINRAAANIELEIEEFTQRWNPIYLDSLEEYFPVPSVEKWEMKVDHLREFAENRQAVLWNYIGQRFDLGKEKKVILDVSDDEKGYVQLDGIDINTTTDGVDTNAVFPWKGNYYKGLPIKVKAIEKPGYEFSHWSGSVQDTAKTITFEINGDVYLKANFYKTNEGVDDNEDEILFYPNPVSDEVTILIDKYEGEYRIFSLSGQVVQAGDFAFPILNLSALSGGVYILEIRQEEKVYRQKLIKD